MSNVGELDRVLRFLEDNPLLHLQATHTCGTSGCVAGWTVALALGARAGDQIERIVWSPGGGRETSRAAQAILGLADVEARRLFYGTLFRHPIIEAGAWEIGEGPAEAEALALGWALLRRDKGCAEPADLDVLRRYGLPEEPQP